MVLKSICRILIFVIFLYIGLLATLYFLQRSLVFRPEKIYIKNPLVNFSENYLETSDSFKIYSWFYKSEKPSKISGIKAMIYFHGNAGSLMNRTRRAEIFANSDISVLMISYRGYANSEGKPSEKAFVLDGLAAVNFLLKSGFKEEEIMLYGESIGSGVAVQLAAKFPKIGMLVLEAPFSSMTNVAKFHYWFVPVSMLLKDKFESQKFASQVKSPVLIFHADGDLVVPFSEGKKLFQEFSSPKKFIEIRGDFHIDLSPEFIVKQIIQFNQSIQLDV